MRGGAVPWPKGGDMLPGRQNKQGLDYWPRSVQLVNDPKLRAPKMKYGYLAVMIYELLLDLLFSDKGYYIDYRRKEDVIWSVMAGLQGKHQPNIETIAECIEGLTACELFSGDLFKREIITSRRAQETFYRATVDRKMVNIDFDIWMLTEQEMKTMSSKSVVLTLFCQNRPNNSINRAINANDRTINEQSKVKESNTTITTTAACAGTDEIEDNRPNNSINRAINANDHPLKYYERYIGIPSTLAIKEIQDFLQAGVEGGLICRAIDKSIDANARNWQYAKSVVNGCITKGILTLDQLEVDEANFRANKAKRTKNRGGGNTQTSGNNRQNDERRKSYGTVI